MSSSAFTLPNGLTVIQRDWLSANHVFLEHNDQTVLIDSGYCTHANLTLQLLRQALHDRSLTTLVNTHLHSDHCGGNACI
ncbi:MAG: MBL fold metallo-hydrolase, partial [Betaproteobacteria bacterium]